MPPNSAIKVFVSYSRKDKNLRDKLVSHLGVLKRQGVIRVWHDGELVPGDIWEDAIYSELYEADIILLLVSASFLDSDFCHKELGRAIERHESGQAIVIPIILRPVYWKDTIFSDIQALPQNAKPVTSWSDQHKAFLSISQGICTAVEELKQKRLNSQIPPAYSEEQDTVFQPLNVTTKLQEKDFDVEANGSTLYQGSLPNQTVWQDSSVEQYPDTQQEILQSLIQKVDSLAQRIDSLAQRIERQNSPPPLEFHDFDRRAITRIPKRVIPSAWLVGIWTGYVMAGLLFYLSSAKPLASISALAIALALASALAFSRDGTPISVFAPGIWVFALGLALFLALSLPKVRMWAWAWVCSLVLAWVWVWAGEIVLRNKFSGLEAFLILAGTAVAGLGVGLLLGTVFR